MTEVSEEMKAIGEAFPIELPRPSAAGAMVVRFDADAGISGYGEMLLLSSAFRWLLVVAMLEAFAEQAVVGHDPYNAEELLDKIYRRAGDSRSPEQTKLAMLSAFDLACWDIVGKDLPVGLVGGITEAKEIATVVESHYVEIGPRGEPMLAPERPGLGRDLREDVARGRVRTVQGRVSRVY